MATERAVELRRGQTPQQALELYRAQGVNLILPAQTLELTTPTHTMAFYAVPVSSDPTQGDVWKVGSVKNEAGQYEPRYALAKTPLERIAVTAGIIWDPKHTRPLQVTEQFIVFQAVGLVRTPSGEVITLTGTKELWMDAIEEEMRAEQTEKVAAKNAEYGDQDEKTRKEIDRRTRKEFISFRRHRMARAETGAKLRAIRSIGLKSQMSKAEIERGFVVGRVVPNYANADARAEMKRNIMALYPEPRGNGDGGGVEPFADVEEAETEDVANGNGTEPESAPEATQAPEPPPDPAPAENAQQAEAEPSRAAAPKKAATGKAKVYVNEEGAKTLVRFAEQFGVGPHVLLAHVGVEHGVTDLTELTTDLVPKVRTWIQEQKA